MSAFDILSELSFIQPDQVKLYRDAAGVLTLKMADGQVYSGVKPVRGFPLTDPDHHILFNDAQNNEIGMLKDTQGLDKESQKVLTEEFNKTYFIPRILRINSRTEKFGILKWDVETDKGRRQFEIQDRDNIYRLTPHHIIMKDIDGNIYEVLDIRQLDKRSFRLLDSEI